MTTLNKLPLNATNLKMIAIVLMVFDHIHQMWSLSGAPIWLTWLGRPVFPIFLFAMAESFHYTHSRKNLLIRLLLASWFMYVFSIVLETLLPNDNIVLMNNAFTTFFVAGLYMLFWDIFRNGVSEKNAKKIIGAAALCFVPILTVIPQIWVTQLPLPQPLMQIAIIMSSCLFPNILAVEGGPLYVLLGALFYVFRNRRPVQIAVLAALSALIFFSSGDPSRQWLMIFAAIPILLYNGHKGSGMKYFFYIFYPAHIYLLYVLATLFPSPF